MIWIVVLVFAAGAALVKLGAMSVWVKVLTAMLAGTGAIALLVVLLVASFAVWRFVLRRRQARHVEGRQ